MNLAPYLAQRRKIIESALRSVLPRRSADALDRAIRYGLLGGGKRLRPLLTLAACESVGGEIERALPFACAVEMIHAYSLIHDDLPAMDDDELRRGRPTVHVVFGEAIAILAGDALLADAFRLASDTETAVGVAPKTRLRLVHELATAAGASGMVRGQARDIAAGPQHRNVRALEETHRRKTGDLLRCSVRMGALVAGTNRGRIEALTRYAECIGLAFQVADDLLDTLGSTATTGKRVGRDAVLAKATFPALLGVSAARDRAESLVIEATTALAGFDARADPLRAIAQHIVKRIPQHRDEPRPRPNPHG